MRRWGRYTVFFALLALLLAAQGVEGQKSDLLDGPREEVVKTVGESAVTISYSRPTAKRKGLWGNLLPYGENWTLGSSKKTTVTFEEDVRLNGIRLGAGTYGLYVFLVNDTDWQWVFNANAAGDPQSYAKSDDVLRIAVRPADAPNQKRLTIGIENIKERRGKHQADLYLHWKKMKAALQLQMTGERRGFGLTIEIPEMAKAPWAVVKSSVDGFIAEDFIQHIRDFSKDFETDFGDGGSAAAHFQLLTNIGRAGMTEGMALNLEKVEIEIDGNEAVFRKLIVYSLMGTLDLTYILQKRDDQWWVTSLHPED